MKLKRIYMSALGHHSGKSATEIKYNLVMDLSRAPALVDLIQFPLTLYRMGGGAKRPPISFFLVTSTNVKVSPNNFVTFRFNPFAPLV